jgi:RimJ/RimL family protein N-acetyltransferase
MPRLIADVVGAGTLGATGQPVLAIDDELELRPFTAADVESVVAAFSTPDIQYFHSRHLDHDEALDWIEECGTAWRSEKSATWAIADRRTATVLGRVAIYLALAGGRGEVSYWVLPDGRGRGVASRACVAATTWAHRIGLRRVELQHSTANSASRRVAVRAGFREEGVRRDALLHTDGWHDMVLYSHLASDVPGEIGARTSPAAVSATPASGSEVGDATVA